VSILVCLCSHHSLLSFTTPLIHSAPVLLCVALLCVVGMGFERMLSVLQNVPTNYDIDSNRSIIQAIQDLAFKRTNIKVPYVNGLDHSKESMRLPCPSLIYALLLPVAVLPLFCFSLSLSCPALPLCVLYDSSFLSVLTCLVHLDTAMKVILDHLRASIFLIADGVFPSNVMQGSRSSLPDSCLSLALLLLFRHVVRRLIRRAIKFGNQLGLSTSPAALPPLLSSPSPPPCAS